jgi:hypothetical protein
VTYAELQTEYERVEKEKSDLLEALKKEHRVSYTQTGWDYHIRSQADCPACQLIQRVEG